MSAAGTSPSPRRGDEQSRKGRSVGCRRSGPQGNVGDINVQLSSRENLRLEAKRQKPYLEPAPRVNISSGNAAGTVGHMCTAIASEAG